MFGTAAALATEMDDFPGGQQALAASVAAGAEALRPLRWPAERMDTLGGYLTYHNVTLYWYFLAIYGVVQGSRAIRGGEERGSLEEVLATGHTRVAVVRDRAAGFALIMAAISLGLGLSVAAGLAVGDEPDLGGSLITMGTCGLVALVGYCLGVLLSQLVGTARAASGIGALLVSGLYVATNVGDSLGPFAAVRYVSPFHYANRSRALVPGYGLDLGATVVLLVLALAMLGLAAWAFNGRDLGARFTFRPDRARPLVAPASSPESVPASHPARIPRRMLGAVWSATLRRGWLGLLVWALGAAGLTAMMAGLQPAVMDVWDSFGFLSAVTGASGSASMEDSYWSFAGELISPVIAAYVITQASGWVADLAQGRVEMTLAGPVSWTMLVRGRLVATTVGVACIIVGALIGLTMGATAVGGSVGLAGMARLLVTGVLLGAALGAVAAIAVAVMRRTAAVTTLAILAGASYLLAYLVPIFGWPDWLNRLSVFWVFGHPYLEWIPVANLLILLGLAIPGSIVAAALAERTPKVA